MGSGALSLRRIPPGPGRDPYLPLLFLADDAHDHVRAHRDDGELFVIESDDGATGAVQAVPTRPDGGEEAGARPEVELTLVAVDERHQRVGVGRALIAAVLRALRDDGVQRVIVGTVTAAGGTITFYQKMGFRPFAIERDYFDAARGYRGDETLDGIPIRDMIWFDIDLRPG